MSAVAGIPVLHFESLDSTNEEALRRLAAGERTPLWIVAGEQTRGRGRSGHPWYSPAGNLYATLVIETRAAPSVATQLSFVAALAVHDAIAAHLPPDQRPHLQLKWPNDVMLGGAKLAGILLESLALPKGSGLAVILGIGINVAHAPKETGRAVASLGLGASAIPQVFASLAAAFEERLARWDSGFGFPAIRRAWLDHALAVNGPVTVNLNGSAIRGRFKGVDAAGALQLETEPGFIITVTAGDVYPDAAV